MANNRLYLVDTNSKEYICLAKCHGVGWDAGNIDLYYDFLETRFKDSHKESYLIIGHENDDDFFDKWIRNGINYNTENKWT